MKKLLALALVAAAQMPAQAATAGTLLFESTGVNCRDFGIIAKVDYKVARALVPQKYALPKTVYGLVELATCDSGTAGDKATGAFKIAEVGIMLPAANGKPAFPFGGPNLYMLWLLDNDPVQSAAKVAVGYPGGIADIRFDPPTAGLVRKIRADIGYDGGYSMSANDITLKINVGKLVTDQYVETAAGTVHTINVVDKSLEGGASIGTITVAPGTQLARLFGKTKVSGISFNGQGTYHNTTELISPAP